MNADQYYREQEERDAYAEYMYERRANGIATCTFTEWRRMKAAFADAYDRMLRQREDRSRRED